MIKIERTDSMRSDSDGGHMDDGFISFSTERINRLSFLSDKRFMIAMCSDRNRHYKANIKKKK